MILQPFLDLPIDYYDLGMENRVATDDKVTVEAAEAILRLGVGIQCATLTPDEARVKGIPPQEDVEIAQLAPSATSWAGWCSASPSCAAHVPRLIPGWTQPIIIGRHAFGDQYKATDFVVPGKGKLTIRWEGEDGEVIDHEVFDYPGGGVACWPCTISTSQSRSSPGPA